MYRDIHFSIQGDYEWGRGYSSDAAADVFHEEAARLFAEAGWQIQTGNRSGICDTAVRGKEELYLHPMQFSGIILESSVPEIERILKQSQSFRYCGIYRGQEYVEMGDAEYREHLESRRGEIEAAILEHFKTKRKNLFRVGDHSEAIARPFLIHRMETRESCGKDLSVLYVRERIEEMVADGRLTESPTRCGRGLRTTGAVKSQRKNNRSR